MSSPNSSDISHVTDTALWVAALRAEEDGRSDAAFHDDLAGLLGGDRGRSIARVFPQRRLVGWSVVVRTVAIDRLIGDALQQGVDTVINIGAGMDARPYRMALPRDLTWVELDFPQLIEAKNRLLDGRVANCRVQRIGLDLQDASRRRAIFRELGAQSRSALLIAEGVIPYLGNQDVAEMAADCLAETGFRYWILDYENAGMRKAPPGWADRLRAAPFQFAVADWFQFFESCGWRTRRAISSGEQADALRRPYPLVFPGGWIMRMVPREVRRRVLGASGAALLERADAGRA